MDQDSRDANSLLVELDRGLLSQNIGDQSEAVVRFTSLFQRYPFPVLVDSACLKLSEAFKYCSNFIRIQICEVLERNQQHLTKIYNVDLFYRNIFTVSTSNDPIARSITLLTLGNIAVVVSGHKSIHHCISKSLDSLVECELNGAIACAANYVKQSSDFACNIYPKMVSIIDSEKTPTDVKIRALGVLDHGFYNAYDAMTVRSFLIDVIEKATLKKLISTCLTLSTKIAFTSLSHITPQIELLIKIFLNDERSAIKTCSLYNLKFLAEKSPHIWESKHIKPLITHLDNCLKANNDTQNRDPFLGSILSIFCKLLTCKCNFISQEEKTSIFHLCFKLALNNSNIPLCSMAFELLTVMSEEDSVANNMIKDRQSDLSLDTLTAIKTFLSNTLPRSNKTTNRLKNDTSVEQNVPSVQLTASKPIYRSIVKLCELNPHYSAEVLKLLYDKITAKDAVFADMSPYICELMCAVHETLTKPVITVEQFWKLIKSKHSEMSEHDFLNYCVLYFQSLRLQDNEIVLDGLAEKVLAGHNLWFAFRVIRQTMRYGHYRLAGLICTQLDEHITTDTTDFYFKSLSRICTAESMLLQNEDLDAGLRTCLPIYEDAVSPLRACVGHSRTTNFHLQYLWLRIRNLQVHATLRQSCKNYDLSPISYIALLSAVGANRGASDLGLSKLCIVQQMPKIAKDFRHLGDCYENLSVVSFDCDNRTLEYLNLLKSSCIIMADAIDAIFQYGKNLPIIKKINIEKPALEYRDLEITCNKLIDDIHKHIIKPGIPSRDMPMKPLIDLLCTFSDKILECPFVYSRYFFQSLQTTQIKLAITPQASSSSSSIVLNLNHNLVLKVEGLIQNLSKRRPVVRKISKLLVSATMTSTKTNDSGFSFFVQTSAEANNNYFKTEFLIPLKYAGGFNVDIGISIVDEQERTWKTGLVERLSLTVS